ncbi:MAG: S-layer homology domain-containing protein [Intestinibacillus sp.]
MKKLQMLSLALILSLCLSIPAFAWTADDVNWDEVEVTMEEPTSTPDNTPSDWAKSEVDKAIAAGLVPVLTGNPGYQDTITREQFAELVVYMAEKIQGGELDAAGSAFNDSSNPAVLKAYAAGIVAGVGDNRFDPNAKTNREQIATMIARAISYLEVRKGKDITPLESDISKFTDKAQVSDWATEAMGTLAVNGIMAGTSATTLSPKSPCTVEQSILLLYRAFEKF